MRHQLGIESRCQPRPIGGQRRRRLLVLLAVTSAAFAFLASAASAVPPVHIKVSVGPFIDNFPAGTLCDFNYHQEVSGTLNIKRFFDANGNFIRVEDAQDVTVLHRNVQTGLTLIEQVHLDVHVDFRTGEIVNTGQSWHLVNEDGRLVLARAGLFVVDLFTGEVVRDTPNSGSDFAQTNCTALGGAPA